MNDAIVFINNVFIPVLNGCSCVPTCIIRYTNTFSSASVATILEEWLHCAIIVLLYLRWLRRLQWSMLHRSNRRLRTRHTLILCRPLLFCVGVLRRVGWWSRIIYKRIWSGSWILWSRNSTRALEIVVRSLCPCKLRCWRLLELHIESVLMFGVSFVR